MNVSVREPENERDLFSNIPIEFVCQPIFMESMTACYMMSSSCWIGEIDRKMVCAWGLIPPTILSNRAYIWLFATKEVEFHQFTFIRQSQIWLKHMLESFDIIYGHVARDNERGRRWLKWLGAEFQQGDQTLLPFEIRKREWPTRFQSAHSQL